MKSTAGVLSGAALLAASATAAPVSTVSVCSPVELPLQVLHVVMALSEVGGLRLGKVVQAAEVVQLQAEERREGGGFRVLETDRQMDTYSYTL